MQSQCFLREFGITGRKTVEVDDIWVSVGTEEKL